MVDINRYTSIAQYRKAVSAGVSRVTVKPVCQPSLFTQQPYQHPGSERYKRDRRRWSERRRTIMHLPKSVDLRSGYQRRACHTSTLGRKICIKI